MKRILKWIVILTAVFAVLGCCETAAAASSGSCGNNLTWVLDENGTLTISGSGPMDSPISFSSSWLSESESIESVIIGDQVTSIGDGAFSNCYYMTRITIPSSVTSIGNWAFSTCDSLNSISLPEALTSIGKQAFYECHTLRSITIPGSVTSIGDEAFGNCSQLTSIQVDMGNEVYASVGGVLFNKDQTVLIRYPQGHGSSYIIPAGVTDIGYAAFGECYPLTDITIPSGLTGISKYAFSGCANLASITIPSSVASIGEAAFSNCNSLTSIVIPDTVTDIAASTFWDCTNLTSVTISANVTSIGESAFSGCSRLASITIPSSVTSIGGSAFSGCSRLASITIPSSVTSIGSGAFSFCRSLQCIDVEADNAYFSSDGGVLFNKQKTVLIAYPNEKGSAYAVPSGVTKIEDNAFVQSSRLTRIMLPSSITEIGNSAFGFCYYLTDVWYCGSSEQWAEIEINQIFNDNLISANIHYIQSILTLPISLTAIESQAFMNLPGVDAVRIPANVNSIAPNAFDPGVTLIVQPDSQWVQWAKDNGYDVFVE